MFYIKILEALGVFRPSQKILTVLSRAKSFQRNGEAFETRSYLRRLAAREQYLFMPAVSLGAIKLSREH